MRSNTSLLGRGLFWIAYGSKSKLESLEESLTRIRVLRVFRGFFGGCFARNLWGKSLTKYGLWPEINHRIVFVKP